MYHGATNIDTDEGFTDDIARMNEMYELQQIVGWHASIARIEKFANILDEECTEIGDVIATLNQADDGNAEEILLDARVQLADLLGDIIVYCASEAQRWNIPLGEVLHIIMQSNFSKLGADGKPIKDERGKFLKGPNYWKPEPFIRELLLSGDAGLDTTQD